jgi:membrane-bound metal-dependent hydrolase YbcI (DUF457 family)
MFIGHFAVGFALKRAEPRVPLGIWFAAALFLDILWPIFLLAGIEKASIVPGITRVTPLNLEIVHWSHSLLMAVVWSVLFAAAVWFRIRTAKAFVWVALAVFSHWILDYITHRPDMPLAPHSEKVGLGLWNSLAGTLIAELSLFIIGVFVYARTGPQFSKSGRIHFLLMVIFFLVMYAGFIFGPPPPNNQTVLAISSLALMPVLFWANWLDRKLGLRS